MKEHRIQRVAETLREELSQIVAFELEDPRLQGVTVNQVHLSPDNRTACVLLSIPGGEQNRNGALAAIEHAKSFIRRELSYRMDLFRLPDLRFEADLTPALANRMDRLFKRIRKGRPRDWKSLEKPEKNP